MSDETVETPTPRPRKVRADKGKRRGPQNGQKAGVSAVDPVVAMGEAHWQGREIDPSKGQSSIEFIRGDVAFNAQNQTLDPTLYGVKDYDPTNKDYYWAKFTSPLASEVNANIVRKRRFGFTPALTEKGNHVVVGDGLRRGLQLLERPRAAAVHFRKEKVKMALRAVDAVRADVLASEAAAKAGAPRSLVSASESVTKM